MANIVTVNQALVIIAFTHFAFKVSWGITCPLLIVFIMVVLSTGLGTMAVMVAKEVSPPVF